MTFIFVCHRLNVIFKIIKHIKIYVSCNSRFLKSYQKFEQYLSPQNSLSKPQTLRGFIIPNPSKNSTHQIPNSLSKTQTLSRFIIDSSQIQTSFLLIISFQGNSLVCCTKWNQDQG
uniref:Uncharacterized protein n=1 Tax=Helianthus annuus TaxID=4232 RepID=A0A251VM40_HELAN